GKRAAAGPVPDVHRWRALGVVAVAFVVLRRSTRTAAGWAARATARRCRCRRRAGPSSSTAPT
ncbi:MAG: hypothetical protein ACK5BN_09020, partial [Planctomycetota bacterium]